MARRDLDGFLRHLPDLRKGLLGVFRKDSCIGTSRVVLELLRERRLRARAGPVEVHALNAAARAGLEPGQDPGGHPPFALSVGDPRTPSPPGRWPGHVVVVCQGRIIDASIDQADRPERGLHLEQPVVVAVDEDFRRDGGMATWDNPRGGLLVYVHRPANQSFRSMPGWGHGLEVLPMARRLLADLERSPHP